VFEPATGVDRKDADAQIAGALARKSGKAFERATDGPLRDVATADASIIALIARAGARRVLFIAAVC
jgi:hypothetical protein